MLSAYIPGFTYKIRLLDFAGNPARRGTIPCGGLGFHNFNRVFHKAGCGNPELFSSFGFPVQTVLSAVVSGIPKLSFPVKKGLDTAYSRKLMQAEAATAMRASEATRSRYIPLAVRAGRVTEGA